MINIATIAAAFEEQLNNDAAVANLFQAHIHRGDYINEDPGRTPWAGIYRGPAKFEPRTLGRGANNWEAYPKIRVAVQATSMKSGDDCEDLLESYVQIIIEAALIDTTIGGTVDMLTAFDIEYSYSEEKRTSLYFQTAIITFDLEVKTS